MQFYAEIIEGSPVDRQWRRYHRVGGVLWGVEFRIRGSLKTSNFSSDELEADDVVTLSGHDSVRLAACDRPASGLQAIDPGSLPDAEAGGQMVISSGVASSTDAAIPCFTEPVAAAPLKRRPGRPRKTVVG